MITNSHLQPTIKYIIYPWNQTVRYRMPETTISQHSPLADYFDDENKYVQQHWIVVCWQHLLVAPPRIFWREGLLTQADCSSSRDSRLSLLSAYCLTILMLCGWRCRQRLYMRLQVTLPAMHWFSQSTDFLFCFYGHFSTEKRKENENAYVFFSRKIKRRKIKECIFWRQKIKRKRNSVGL